MYCINMHVAYSVSLRAAIHLAVELVESSVQCQCFILLVLFSDMKLLKPVVHG